MALLVKQEQVEQVVWEDTLHKSAPVENRVNQGSVIQRVQVIMEGWVRVGWGRVVQELLLITGRGEGRVLKDGWVVAQVE